MSNFFKFLVSFYKRNILKYSKANGMFYSYTEINTIFIQLNYNNKCYLFFLINVKLSHD